MKKVKCLSVTFTDKSEIDIWNDNTATIYMASKGFFAYDIWNVCSKDKSLKSAHLHLFEKCIRQLDVKHNIILKIVDHYEVENKRVINQLSKAF